MGKSRKGVVELKVELKLRDRRKDAEGFRSPLLSVHLQRDARVQAAFVPGDLFSDLHFRPCLNHQRLSIKRCGVGDVY